MKQFQCNIDLYCPEENTLFINNNEDYICGFQQGCGEDIELLFTLLQNGTPLLSSNYTIDVYKATANLLDYCKTVEYITTLTLLNANTFAMNKNTDKFKTLFEKSGKNELIFYVNGSPTTGWEYYVHSNPTYYLYKQKD